MSVHARNTDPYTSHLAAASVNNVSELQRRILTLFQENLGGMTDETMIQMYTKQYGSWFPATDSSLRSRRAQLRDQGVLGEIRVEVNERGRKTILWGLEGTCF